jgi:hypothetical protein
VQFAAPVAPAALVVPSAHGAHASLLSNVPAGHGWQNPVPASRTAPATHTHAAALLDPAGASS